MKIIPETISSNDSILTVQAFYLCGSLLPGAFFKIKFRHHSIYWSKGNLVLNPDYNSFRSSKNSPTMETKVWYLTAIFTWKTTRSFNNELIQWKRSPNSYLSHYIIASLYIMTDCLIKSGLRFIERASVQAAHLGAVQFGVDLNLGNMKGWITLLNPSFSVDFLSLIIYWIQCILVPIFQRQNRISLCGTYKFLFSSDPAHGQKILYSKYINSWILCSSWA